MDLHELRRKWQQPEAALPPLSSAQLDGLLAQRTGGLVEKLLRNARYEAIFNVVMGLAMPVMFFVARNPLHKAQAALLFLMSASMFVYYRRKLRMLRRMSVAEINVRENLQRLCSGLRDLLRFYYRLSLWAGPWSLILIFGYYVGQELARAEAFRWERLGLMAVFLVVLGGLLQLGAVYGTRWYIQRLYGQHLDRLEANLRELGDESPAL